MSGQKAEESSAGASSSAATTLYTAPVKKEDRVPFDGPPGYAGAIPAGAAVDGAADTMRTSVDTQLAIQRLSRDVYSEKTSAPREDMANESTSARIAIERHGARPRIRVVLDENTRRFSVQGLDTMGCTWDAFAKALAVIGITTNADPGRAGQMGMGFYSNTLLSDTIIFESHSRETGERFTAMCKGGTEWQVGLKSAPMPEFGARVSMTVRPGVDMSSLEKMVWKCARLAPCPVSIEAEGGADRRDLPTFCCARSLARKIMYRQSEPYMARYGYADRGDAAACNPVARPGVFVEGMRDNDIDGCLCLHGQKDGVEVCAIFVSTYHRVSDGGGKRRVERRLKSKWRETQAYLVGMPINLDYFSRSSIGIGGYDDGGDGRTAAGRFRDASILVVRVHDERRYRPTADRERFDEDSERRIVEAVDEILAEQMAAVRWPDTLAEHLRGPYRAAMDMALDSGSTMGSNRSTMAVPEVGEREAAMCMAGRLPVRNGFARHSMPLCHALEAAPRSVLDSSVSASRIMAVARHDPSVKVIVARRAGELSESGIEAIGDYMERVGIEPLTGDEIAAYEKSEEWRAVRVSYGLPYEDDGRSYGASRCIFYTSGGSALKGAASLNRDRSRIQTRGLAGVVVARSRLGSIVGAMRASDAPYAVASVGGKGRGMRAAGDGTALVRGILWPGSNGRGGDDDQPGVRIISEDDFLAAAAAATYRTSCGEMTGDEIAHHNGRIAVMQYGDDAECERLAAAIGGSAWFGRPGTLYAVCGGDEHFALVSLLGAATAAAAAGRGDPAALPLSAGRIVRVLALPAIPDGEKKKSMMPAGAPVLLCDEIAECGGKGAGRHAGIAARRVGDWTTQMDLLLASLEIRNADILAALAGSAPAFSATDRRGTGEGVRLASLIDGAIEAEAALAASPPAPEPPARHVYDLDRKLVDAGNQLLAGAKKWIARGCQGAEIDALRGATMDEAGAHAAGRTYLTNNGPRTGAEIVAECMAADRIAADILVYERDAAGLAEALPAAGAGAVRTVAVVPAVDDAVELGCAIAAAGMRCRIGGDGEGNKRNGYARHILQDAVPRNVLAGLELRTKYGSSNWWGFPCAWHGLLTVRNGALRGLLAEALDVYDAGLEEASAFGALVDRFRWLDGQRPCGPGDCGSAGAGRNADPAAEQAAGHAKHVQAPDISGASKRGD